MAISRTAAITTGSADPTHNQVSGDRNNARARRRIDAWLEPSARGRRVIVIDAMVRAG
jgi:hypothetical protein